VSKSIALATDGYADFIGSLAPMTIALISESFRIDRIRYLESKSDSISVKLSSKLVGLGEEFFDVRSALDLKISEVGEKQPLVKFTAVYDLHFHAVGVTQARVEKFIDSEQRLVIWPYFRELVSNASARMHVPPIILPVGGNPG
jgi:preprotein translocase subunit SecB